MDGLVAFDKGCSLECQLVIFVLQLGFEHLVFYELHLLLFGLPFGFGFFLFFLMQVSQVVAEHGLHEEPDECDIDQPRPYGVIPGRTDFDGECEFGIGPLDDIFADF